MIFSDLDVITCLHYFHRAISIWDLFINLDLFTVPAIEISHAATAIFPLIFPIMESALNTLSGVPAEKELCHNFDNTSHHSTLQYVKISNASYCPDLILFVGGMSMMIIKFDLFTSSSYLRVSICSLNSPNIDTCK